MGLYCQKLRRVYVYLQDYAKYANICKCNRVKSNKCGYILKWIFVIFPSKYCKIRAFNCDITMSFTSISHSVIGLRHYRASVKLIQVHLKPRKLHRVFTQRYLGKLKKDPSLDKLISLVLKCVKNAFYCIYILFLVF